ncbi:unnamed protein product, partial [Mesorhabditis belari]|uniref:UDP-N-acetylglucosamine--dolichyl-phosphate N-acetylglucosaminephosphotransferase n=1 Tax=Mesorhabditis belari TaxID=2138241 RepID=A0AAF3J8N7_9BILA
MSSLSIDDEALLAGINCHMRHLNNGTFTMGDLARSDPDLYSCSGSDSDSDSDSERIVEPRDLVFNVNTIQKTVEKGTKARFRGAARRMMPGRRQGRCSAYKMHPGFFAEKFNRDFTNILVDQQPFSRGGSHYIRPLGSMRYALDVLNKYGDNAWLGDLGGERPIENGSIHGEWPVAYHGTTDPRAASIVTSGGLDLKKGHRFLYGHGIYCTPDPKTALAYASPYKHNGKWYKLILQSRVDPSHREIVPKSQHDSSTTIVVPKIARYFISLLGFEVTNSLDINLFYYVFMGMVIVFCTNSIIIYPGINELEVGQSLVIASSITLYNVIQLYRLQDPIECWYNWLSIYFLLPFITTSWILYNFNKYPARVFVGDTYCYWAGMTLAVVAILGHFSKTAMLFFIPQAFNFIYSTPQLFHLVPCPRHRLPKFDSKTDTVGMSFAEFKKSELNRFGQWVVTILSTIGLPEKISTTMEKSKD